MKITMQGSPGGWVSKLGGPGAGTGAAGGCWGLCLGGCREEWPGRREEGFARAAPVWHLKGFGFHCCGWGAAGGGLEVGGRDDQICF